MLQTTATSKLNIPAGTRVKLTAFRRRVWTIKIAEGFLAGVCGLLISYLLVFVLDRFVDTPAFLRALILVTGAVGLGVLFPLKCHRWVWRTRRFDQLARLLKHRMPRLSDRMLGIIELAQSDTEQQRSATLCEAALRQVDEEIRDRSFSNSVPHPRHWAWCWAAGVPLGLALLALVVVPAAGTNTLARWLMPWKQTERYTFARLNTLPEQLVVPYAEQFPLSARLANTSEWLPEKATAQIGKQPAVEAELAEDEYQFAMPPQKEDGELMLAVGDVREKILIQPKLRPELKELIARVKLPDYLQYSSLLEKDVRGGSVSVVKGSEATLLAKASRDLAEASLNGATQSVTANVITTSGQLLQDSAQWELSWSDAFGLTAKQPFRLSMQVNDDLAPSVVCNELDRQQVILVDQVLTFEVNADDDFGLKYVGIEWQGIEDPLLNPNPAQGETLIIGGSPEAKEVRAQASFSAQREGIEPQTLQVRLFAIDYLPDRERVYSPPYTLFVLSAEDHANWLTEQMRRWSRQAQAVYERENQLYENNKALRNLPPEELDTAQNRQRIETQAAAESTNARRLAAVSAAGKQLIKEAARNDQFNVMTMEGLAEMVNTLDELARNRMPSVADLLQQAARATGASPASEPSESSPGESKPRAPQVGNNRDPLNMAAADSSQQEDDSEDSKPVPSITDIESSFNQPDKAEEQEHEQEQTPAKKGGGTLGLPTTTILGGGADQNEDEGQDSPQEKLDEAIAEQEDLLDAFAEVADELQRILDNLEGSTFVKRLKAASRRQLQVAGELNASLAANFGRRPRELAAAAREESTLVAERERAESDNLLVIKQDLEAYYNRVQQGKFRTVMHEMDDLNVAEQLDELAGLVTDNYHGQSIAHAEFWADTFDRWAEQLVGPG